MKDIFFYETMDAWIKENPTTSIKGYVLSKNQCYIEISDENGFIQIININKIFAVVY